MEENELQTGNQHERERVNPHTMVGKTFYSPFLHEEDERPRSEGVGRNGFHVVERRESVEW